MLDQKSVHCTYSTLLCRVKSVEINSSKEILLVVVVFWPDEPDDYGFLDAIAPTPVSYSVIVSDLEISIESLQACQCKSLM